ncbi:RNA-directed DNA polymerase [Shewanella oncorhynchi]|uniref:RNA-directed DNA polymerase n=1 Tax=Shewanella oncorhynchi TaxID=2726434 RepID=UPI003D7AA749
MPLLSNKQHELSANIDCLSDKVVLAQAWKKTHQYIRSTNWYADTFELDRSAIGLDKLLDKWILDLNSKRFMFKPLQLVPAPKSCRWDFEHIQMGSMDFTLDEDFDGLSELSEYIRYAWKPTVEQNKQIKELRPLAHIDIRDQTIMTALMMCLANKVETEQGDTSSKFAEVHDKGIISYGNRLYCKFNSNEADFNWGNSTTYSKYFSDYRQFLSRPAHFGGEVLQNKAVDERVYEVHLDLEKFYDKIDRERLVDKLGAVVEEDVLVKRLLKAFKDWKWKKDTDTAYKAVCCPDGDKQAPCGIPQGLVAGGFLANVYLLDFDRWLSEQINSEIIEGIRLVDACRYVDDMRLIIVSREKNINVIKDKISKFFNCELNKLGLNIQEAKTKIEVFRAKKAGISFKLKNIQSKISGPLSVNEIDEQLGHLEGLIGLAESLRTKELDENNNNPLALIDGPTQDVREDTLLRFSANKIHFLLRQKRSLIAQDVDETGNPIPGNWDYLQERLARRFIACWSKDPSLVLLLKKGLEFFPDKRLLKPVISQLKLVRKRSCAKQKAISEYCLCEIFRHAATVIHGKEHWANPAHADVNSFFAALQDEAVNLLCEDKFDNPYLSSQMRFLLLVRNDSLLGDDSDCAHFDLITKLMKGYRRISVEHSVDDFVANCVLAYQLAADKPLVLRAIDAFLEKLNKRGLLLKKDKKITKMDIEPICKGIAMTDMDLFSALVNFEAGKAV